MRNCRLWSVFSNAIPLLVGIWVIGLWPVAASAVVNVATTRVIFNAQQKSVSLNLANSEKQPTLVQLWSDDGDPLITPDKASTPVIVVPPLFRMAPGELRSVRLLLVSREPLAPDRESLYWLNIYQIPPNTMGDVARKERILVLPLRIRMKVFVRPTGVEKPVEQDGGRLQFSWITIGNNTALRIINPTVWFMNLTGITLANGKPENAVVAPKSTVDLPFSGTTKPQQIKYQVINDEGNRWLYTATINVSVSVRQNDFP